jgi:sarcosine oxidase subunit alpha
MPDVTLTIDGTAIQVPEGSVVATALATAGIEAPHRSTTGEPRGPLCGMGMCGECRVTVNGVPHVRSCHTVCETGMEVTTDAPV